MPLKIALNQRFGKLTVIERVKEDLRPNKNKPWKCRCDCGNENFFASGNHLIEQKVRSCGCAPKTKFTPKLGGTYGAYLIRDQSKIDANIWNCKCIICNQEIELRTRSLINNPSCVCSKPKTKSNDFLIKSLIKDYKDSAKNKNRDFKLCFQDCVELFQGNCYYCGTKPSQIKKASPCRKKFKYSNSEATFIFNGIDRINNNNGYTSDNVVSCCRVCNLMKAKLNQPDFMALIEGIVYKDLNKESVRSKIIPFNEVDLRCGNLRVVDKIDESNYKVQCTCSKLLNVDIKDFLNSKYRSCGCSKDSGRALPIGEGAFNVTYSRYKSSAEKRGLAFHLSKEVTKVLFNQRCHYCNILPSKETKIPTSASSFRYNGIDRLDNNIGYIIENCVPACSDCNHAKGEYGLEEFKEHVGRIYNKLLKKNTDI